MKFGVNKRLILCLALLAIGVVCLVLENQFYQYVDENGYLKESFFLPLGTFSLLLGGIGSVIIVGSKIWFHFVHNGTNDSST